MKAAFWVLVAALVLVSPGPVVGASPACRALQYISDPSPDTMVKSVPPLVDTRPAEILNTSIERTTSGLLVMVKLAGDPRAQSAFEFSYWVGFQDGGKSLGANPPTWTFQNSASYARIATMYWDKVPASYPVSWNATTFSFVIPWTDFAAFYNSTSPVPFGSPFSASSGPYAAGSGINSPGEDSDDYSQDLVPLPSCPPPASPSHAPVLATKSAASLEPLGPMVAIAVLAVGCRRR
ncbi:MAG: hypothetical protein ACYDBQ_07500 [Thermoplasmatota archaeon]